MTVGGTDVRSPRTMVIAGGSEMVVGQINASVGRMKRDLGEKVHYYEVQDALG